MNRRASITLLMAVFVFRVSDVGAGIVLNDPEMWTNAPSLSGWSNADPTNPAPVDASLSNPGAGGAGPDSGGYLRVSFSAQGGPPSEQDDIVYSGGTNYTGSYQIEGLTVGFNFLAEDMLPEAAALYFHSTVSGNIWEFSFRDALTAGQWSSVGVPFNYDYGWVGAGGAAEFWNDLASVDWIGVDIARAWNVSAQDYGIDNWNYFIPEPGALTVLTAAFLSLAVTFRRRNPRRNCLSGFLASSNGGP